jgi:hypothetical protein
MLCKVCELKPVSLRGASTCSLHCATTLCGEDPEPVKTRLLAEAYRVDTICRNERERLQKLWKQSNPGLML